MDHPDLASLVAGTPLPGPGSSTHPNPARPSEVVSTVRSADRAVADAAIAAADRAAAGWRSTPAPARGEVLRRTAQLVDERAATIARDLTREEGKTLAESTREVQLAAKLFWYYAAQTLDPDGETYPSHHPDLLLYTRREPLGVVSVITPWNFPASLPAWKLAGAVAFGNAVVWKPAENVPRTAVHLATALADAGLPAGVLNVVLGHGRDVGDALVTDPRVAAVTFTGSNAVGGVIRQRAASAGKKLQLELGGKNPAIVAADADLDLAAREISVAAFGATGQKCTATSRVLVERPVLDGLVERLRERAAGWVLGDPLDPATTVGPVATGDQLRTVLGYLDRAARDGGRAVAGGGRANGGLSAGYFVEPTVLLDLDPAHPAACEEVFGPVLVVLPVDSPDHAITLANDTPYGLAAGLFTRDVSGALRFADRIRAGVVRINRATSGMEYHVPFGGTKASGYGHREMGKAAQEFFTESKTVYLGSG